MRTSLFVTCLGDMFYPEVGVAIVRPLRRLGVTVEFPAGQTCDGLIRGGHRREHLELGEEDVQQVARYGAWLVADRTPAIG